jgi:hypothetical protein
MHGTAKSHPLPPRSQRMSTEKVVRYTAEQMRAEANFAEMRGDGSITSEMLRQAARTEADVAGLVEVLKALMRGYVNTLTWRHTTSTSTRQRPHSRGSSHEHG